MSCYLIVTNVSQGLAVSSPGQDSNSTLASIKSFGTKMNLLCLWHIINWKQRTFESCHISIFKNHSGHKYSRQRCIWPPFSPWSSSVGRVWLCVCSPGLGSRTEIRSEAYCLAGKTRIIFLTFSYLHATMREDRMSKLFRKISPYTEKHLHLLLVSSSTSTQWAGPLYCACICVCACVFALFTFFLNRFPCICVS